MRLAAVIFAPSLVRPSSRLCPWRVLDVQRSGLEGFVSSGNRKGTGFLPVRIKGQDGIEYPHKEFPKKSALRRVSARAQIERTDARESLRRSAAKSRGVSNKEVLLRTCLLDSRPIAWERI
jgi:hypothetical protein